jgi:hypothetical protein
MSANIVTFLRDCANDTLLAEKEILFRQAADEIERLRAELDRLGPLMLRASAEIRQARAERDEARREVCIMNESGLRLTEIDKKREAERRGWDCFKEEAK